MRQVAKFGGSSVANAEAISQVLEIIKSLEGQRIIAVSAMMGVTDKIVEATHAAIRHEDSTYQAACKSIADAHLEAMHALVRDKQLWPQFEASLKRLVDELFDICKSLSVLGEHSESSLDLSVSRGERLMAQLLTLALTSQGTPAEMVDGTEIIEVRRRFGMPFPDLDSCRKAFRARIDPLLRDGKVVIVPGFIGRDEKGRLITLGRGGTDLTATVLGSAADADKVTLFKEVPGVFTADPRKVPEAKVVADLHYREATEMAYYGAKVLHPRTIIPLQEQGIPLFIRNTFEPNEPGTRIAGDVEASEFPVKGLTAIHNQALVSVEGRGMMGVPGVAAKTFATLSRSGFSVSVISQASSEASICFAVDKSEADAVKRALEEAFELEIESRLIDQISVRYDAATIAIVGMGMSGIPGIAARCFQALGRARVNVLAIAQGASELNISAVVEEAHVDDALRGLHREFRLEKMRILPWPHGVVADYAILGFGQIGRTLLDQMAQQKLYFEDKLQLKLRCIALADSSGITVANQGFSDEVLNNLIAQKKSGRKLCQPPDPTMKRTDGLVKAWHESVLSSAVPKGIVVDTTAGDTFPIVLASLRAGFHVVLANKKPMAVPYEQYCQLLEAAKSNNVQLRIEATVGAGLPVLDTLDKLSASGDEIHKIEGCFSGTLGFLMSQLENGLRFSDAVGKAFAEGYTEPDPREDLSGQDVARKALILARKIGFTFNMEDIEVEALFDDKTSHEDPAEFIENLKQNDEDWVRRVAEAKARGQVLRYVATVESKGLKVGVQAVDKSSPLGSLKGTDNQVHIQTKRYKSNPLVVTGPGAGAGVTAQGVLNDIIAIAASRE